MNNLLVVIYRRTLRGLKINEELSENPVVSVSCYREGTRMDYRASNSVTLFGIGNYSAAQRFESFVYQ